MKRTKLTQQQIDMLAASFLPVIREYFQSEEGRAEYQKYLEEKEKSADNAKSAEKDTDDHAA